MAVCVLGISDGTAVGGVPFLPTPYTLPLDLGIVGAPGCSLLVSPDVVVNTVTQTLATGGGVGHAAFSVPSLPALVGVPFYCQWFVANAPGDPSLFCATKALHTVIQ